MHCNEFRELAQYFQDQAKPLAARVAKQSLSTASGEFLPHLAGKRAGKKPLGPGLTPAAYRIGCAAENASKTSRQS
jgi:hypothetical protein